MNHTSLEDTACALVAAGKGILAADESFRTIQKRFAAINIESSEENRRAYREMLFTTQGIEEFISGVILFDETIRQKTGDRTLFTEALSRKGIIPGIKVDTGTVPMPGHPGEKITSGLDGLRERLNTYRDQGARFAKWRAVITIGPRMPSRACIRANAHQLALYAALTQEAEMVPIVEPEVLMDGDHDIAACEESTLATLTTVFSALRDYGVSFEGMLLKPNMVVAGKQSPKQASIVEAAETTVRTLRKTVPAAVRGIVFLSGGQSPELATGRLNAMNVRGPHPWELSFSFGRALQDTALKTWKGSKANIAAAKKEFIHRAKCCGAARYGTYSENMEKMAA
ncbi:MAG TPA: class I fructose-bisphosphate aldolase [Nitrospirota bacterium]|nr:class I fructose-bisphosphate aldolase [Nitrospirota bacterium]